MTNFDALAEASQPFWPPVAGDVWISRYESGFPKPWVCTGDGILGGDHSWNAETVRKDYGILLLVWRNGQPHLPKP